ncbi:MAG: sterol desaturase family protein [Calditrichaeota bacterium]|nr:sterol desaturase family protein [Calditrichota bacterium]
MNTIIYYAIPFFIISMIVEYMLIRQRKSVIGYHLKDTSASISMGLGNVATNLIGKILVLASLTFVYQFRLFDIPWAWWSWILIIFADDLVYYIFHRTSHICRFFWASHVIHHSSQHYNLSTALRQTWTGNFCSFIFWLPLSFIGFDPIMVMTMQSISLLYQFWIHTEGIKRMGILEKVMNTPSHHRVHHGSNIKYLDKNLAGIFIIWDKLFGSFKEEEETPEYGISHNLDSYNPLYIAFHEWIDMWRDIKTAKSIREIFGYVFKAPGWSPDGSRKTSKELQAELGL